MPGLFSLIKEINPTKMTWALKLRLVRVYGVPSYGNNQELWTLECVFHDVEGMRVHGTIKRNQIQQFQPILQENNLYAVKNFIVAENNTRYKTTTGEYKIIFVPRTRVTEFSDISFPSMMYDFKSFDTLINTETIDDSILIDVIGRLATKYSPQDKEIGGRQTRLMDIVIEDLQGARLSCTLWGDYVEELVNHLSTVGDDPVIILLQMCRMKKFRGETRVSNTYFVTKMTVDNNLDEIADFRSRMITSGTTSTPVSVISSTKKTVLEELESEKDKLRTLEQILDTKEVGSFWVYAKIAVLEVNGDWWYLSCKQCPKKLIPAEGKLYCERCDDSFTSGNIRYKIQVRVVDGTGNAAFLMWDRECNELLGKTALDMKTQSEQGGFPEEIENLVDLKALFKVQIKSGQVGNCNAVYSVININVEDSTIAKVCQLHLDNQESDIFSKLKGSDFETTNELCSSDDEVTTPLKKSTNSSIEVAPDSKLKRNLIDEFSANGKEMKLKIEVKKEKN